MLSKLIKYEWKDTWAVGTICSIVVLGLTLIGILVTKMDILRGRSRMDEVMAGFTATIIMLWFMMFIWGIIAMIFIVKYYFFYRYYKNLFTDHGYLMNTLPVKSTELINAKLMVAIIWQYITSLVVSLCIFLLVISMAVNVGEVSFSDMWDSFSLFFREIWKEMWLMDDSFLEVMPFFICVSMAAILWPIAEMLLMYAAVGIGQLSKKWKFLVAVLILIGFNVIKTIVGNFIYMPIMLVADRWPSNVTLNIFAAIWLFIVIGMVVGFYFANKYFLERKLNLE